MWMGVTKKGVTLERINKNRAMVCQKELES